jgi:hypothetical protein
MFITFVKNIQGVKTRKIMHIMVGQEYFYSQLSVHEQNNSSFHHIDNNQQLLPSTTRGGNRKDVARQ